MKRNTFLALLMGFLSTTGLGQPLPPPIRISVPSNNSSTAAPTSIDRSGLIRAARATPVRRHVMSNGLRVLVNESPQENIVALELLIQVGAMEESTPLEGIGQVLQELLTQRVRNGPHNNDRIEDSAAQFQVTPEMDYLRLSLVCSADEYPALLAAVADALKKGPVTENELEEVRKILIRNLDQGQGALGQLYDIFRQSFYRYHPYKRTGRVAEGTIERLKPKALQDFLDKYLVANRMVLSICGRVDRNEAVDKVQKLFAALPQKELHRVEVNWEAKSTEKEVFLTGGGQVGWLFVGFPAPPAPSRDYVGMRVINSVLGEGLSSRLFTEIREKRSLCYELGSMYPVLRGPSHFLTYTVTKPEQVWPARKQLLIEIERLKKEGVSEQELEENKRKIIGAYWQERETNQGRAFHAALNELLGLGHEFDSQYMRLLDSVTTQDVKDVAQRYLDNATLIVARPRGIFYWDL